MQRLGNQKLVSNKTHNLVLVTKYFTPILSGPGKRFLRINHFLKQYNIKLTVLTILHKGNKKSEIIDGINVYRLKINSESDDKTYELQKKSYLIMKKIDVDTVIFIQHSYKAFIYILLLRLKKIKCIKNVTMMPSKSEKNIKSFIFKQLNYNVFSKLYCISDAMKKTIDKY